MYTNEKVIKNLPIKYCACLSVMHTRASVRVQSTGGRNVPQREQFHLRNNTSLSKRGKKRRKCFSFQRI